MVGWACLSIRQISLYTEGRVRFCLAHEQTFRPWKIDEPLLLPPVVQEFVAKDHLARLVLNLVREDIDFAAISGSNRRSIRS
jgi:hypothetical protein